MFNFSSFFVSHSRFRRTCLIPVIPPDRLCRTAGIAPWGVTPQAARGGLILQSSLSVNFGLHEHFQVVQPGFGQAADLGVGAQDALHDPGFFLALGRGELVGA